MKNRRAKNFALFLVPTAALLCALGCGDANIASPLAANMSRRSNTANDSLWPTGGYLPWGAPLTFVNFSNPPTGSGPGTIVVADFNGDGKLDLAVPAGAGTLNILMGSGDGTFTAAPTVPLAGLGVNNVVVGDFNGDGNPDLAVSLPNSNQVQILLGNGDGTFSPMPPISATGIFKVETFDFNRDGKADLLEVNGGAQTLTILLGRGDGTFNALAPVRTVPSGVGPLTLQPVAVTFGDFNQDGIPDIAAANSPFYQGEPGTVTVLLGNGDGTFTAQAESPATGNSPLCIAAGDLNGDGIPDLVVSNMNHGAPGLGDLTVLLGKGDGTFAPAPETPQTGPVPYFVIVADFNGDRKADLVTANLGSNRLTVLLGNGDGTFTRRLSPWAGETPSSVAVGDFNGDGIPDLAVPDDGTNSVAILITHRNQSQRPPR